MTWRAPAFAALLAIALGASIVAVWRHPEVASTAPREAGAARRSSEVRLAEAPPRPTPRGAAPSASSSSTEPDEAELMSLLRSARNNDAELVIELAREGNRRFPQSPDAPERASMLIHALAEQGLASEARGQAEDMVNRYPDSTWVREVERFTGAHRHRDLRVGPNGELHYEDPAPPT
jgi:hypothetical protein